VQRGLLILILVAALTGTSVLANARAVERVEIYTTSWCPYCRKAEAFFKANAVAYVNYDIEKDKQAARRKRQLDRRKGVPLTVINGQVIYGFSEKLYRTALGLD